MSLNINLVAEANVAPNDQEFLQRIFASVARDKKRALSEEQDPLVAAIFEEYNSISWRADRSQIQASTSIRNVLRSRAIALALFDDGGRLDLEHVQRAIQLLEKALYPLGPGRLYDSERQEWILTSLKRLEGSKELQRLVQNVHASHANPIANELIRETLRLTPKDPITDREARAAALSAWFTYLRQSVGSCFATAPTIIIHQEQSEQFFRDVAELLTTGQLKRTFGGKEYAAPLSPSWGAGDLKRQIVVRKGESDNQLELWLCPGILNALVETDLIDGAQPLRTRLAQAKAVLAKAIDAICGPRSEAVTSSETLLKTCLMQHLEMPLEQTDDEQARGPIFAVGGVLQGSFASGGATHKSRQLTKLMEQATVSFKLLADNALLKSWEFTVASFAETKPTFTRWNLYASLGVNYDDVGGIGECIYTISKDRLDRQNNEVQDYQAQYDMMYPLVKNLESRLRTASTEKEIRWLKSDYQSKSYEFRRITEMRDDANRLAHWWANIPKMVLSYYDMLFPQYFQEVYDADMHDVGPNPYDDSPAGFRLLYKWGRTNSSQWTRIHTVDEYIDALANFFTITERELSQYAEFEGREKELSDLISEVVRRVRSREFIESAFDRMADKNRVPRVKDPLNNLDKVSKKPWVYTSGGSLDSLVGCYWKREEKLTQVEKWMESPTELLVTVIDALRDIPNADLDPFLENPTRSMLMHSPTHAFLLKPGSPNLRAALESKSFTYTWVRDKLILPRERFSSGIKLDVSQMQFLVDEIAQVLPLEQQHYFRKTCGTVWGTASPMAFRAEVEKKLGSSHRGLASISMDLIDTVLYRSLPLTSIEQLEKRVETVVSAVPGMDRIKKSDLNELLSRIQKNLLGIRCLTAQQLISICCSVVLIALNETSYSEDLFKKIVSQARLEGYLLPEPILFADTNWVHDKFAFVVNPGTAELEFWRTDPLGYTGSPISAWKQWLDGSHKEHKWGVYTRPSEYVTADGSPFQIR